MQRDLSATNLRQRADVDDRDAAVNGDLDERPVRARLQAAAPRVANREPDLDGIDAIAECRWQESAGQRKRDDRNAEQVARDHIDGATYGDRRRGAVFEQVERDLRAGVAEPTTSTRMPRKRAPFVYSLLWSTGPPNTSRPRHDGSRGMRLYPVATTRQRLREGPASVCNSQLPSPSRAQPRTSTPKCGRRPKVRA